MMIQTTAVNLAEPDLPPTEIEKVIEDHKKAARHHEIAARSHYRAIKLLKLKVKSSRNEATAKWMT